MPHTRALSFALRSLFNPKAPTWLAFGGGCKRMSNEVRVAAPGVDADGAPAVGAAAPVSLNTLLSRVPPETQAAWLPAMVQLYVITGAVLLSAGVTPRHVYFPLDAVVAQMHGMSPGGLVCLNLIGREGMVGSSAALGGQPATSSFVVTLPGTVVRMEAGHLRVQMQAVSATQHVLLDYVQTQITETANGALCTRFHLAEARLCTRLLRLFTTRETSALALTQDDLASMVDVRRERINQALGQLQAAGLVEAGRGVLRLLDRPGLVQRACACHSRQAAQQP